MKGRWNRNHSYILIGLVASSILVFLISSSQVISPLEAEAESLQSQSEMYSDRLASLDSEDVKGPADGLEELREKVPATKSVDSVLSHIEERAKESGTDIIYIGADPNRESSEESEEAGGPIGESYFVIDATAGSLDEAHRFLGGITGNERLFRIDTLEIEQSETGAFLTLSITSFHQVQQ